MDLIKMDPQHLSVPDWTSKIIRQQYVDPKYHMNRSSDIVFNGQPFPEYKFTYGNGYLAMTTKLLFIYLGGLYYARKQFIPSYLYFTNRNYNFLGASKFLLGGYLVGELISIFTWGNPFLVEDQIRRVFRSIHTVPEYEKRTLN